MPGRAFPGFVWWGGREGPNREIGLKNEFALKFPFFRDFWQTPEDPNCTLVEFGFICLEYLRPGEMVAEHYEI